MFVLSVHKRQIRLGLLLLALALIAVACAVVSRNGTAVARSGDVNLRADTADERIAYLSQFGWQVDADPVEVSEVVIPTTFDDTYTQYNAIQQAQGFDLLPYAGQRVKRWVYRVRNYPGYEEMDCIQATLLVFDGQVIGGDVCSTQLDGFMHGFVKEAAETQPAETQPAA